MKPAFSRFTQLGYLRLMTTAAAMDSKPLSMREAWHVFGRLFEDERVVLAPEPAEAKPSFEKTLPDAGPRQSSGPMPGCSPSLKRRPAPW